MTQQTLSRFFSVQKTKKASPENESITDSPIEIKTEDNTANKLKSFAYSKYTPINAEPKLKSEIKKKRQLDDVNESNNLKKCKNLTDFEQQILNFKLNHMDKLLFIQSGYRYKFFGEDAIIASKLLNIKLTEGKESFDLNHPSKDDHLYSTFAQASIPIERLLVHVRRLVVKGYKVGVVDQIETAAIRSETKSKSRVFDRHLSHVYSSGTFINDEDLEKNVTGKSILFISESIDGKISIISVNVYVTEIVYDQFMDDFTRINLESRFHHLEPIEIITLGDVSHGTRTCIENFIKFNDSNTSNIKHIKLEMAKKPYNEILSEIKEYEDIKDDIFTFLSNLDYKLLNVFKNTYEYLKEYNLTAVFAFIENYKDFAMINKNTILNANVLKGLEIFNNTTDGSEKGSLFELIDNTSTKFGQRLLKNWLGRPLIDKVVIFERQDAVESLINKMNSFQIEKVKNLLKGCPDLELILARIHYGRSTRKEVYLFLKKVNEILNCFKNIRDELISIDVLNSNLLYMFFKQLKELSETGLLELQNYLSMIYSPSAMDSKSPDHITTYFNTNFYNYKEIQDEKDEIFKVNEMMDIELDEIKKITKNKDLQFVKVNNEPYLIQIRKPNIKNVPEDWIRINATINCARYRSPEVVRLYKKLQYHEDILKNVCNEQFHNFTEKISSHHSHIIKLIKHIASFDALLSLALTSINNNFNKPKIVDFPTIQIKNSRNPISEKLLKEKPTFRQSNFTVSSSYSQHSNPLSYIENDFFMQKDNAGDSRIALITGPNMGGKSSFMRQIGLIIILSQTGCFVPCDEGSIIGVFENICIRLGSNDAIFSGKSTFQVELTECYNILEACSDKISESASASAQRNRNGNSLILMDELGRGTSTTDGCSIAWSVLDYLTNEMSDNVLCLFVTHFKELEVFENLTNGVVKNYHLGYKVIQNGNDSDILFTYKITPRYSSGSYGVHCAKIAGLPKEIVTKANQVSDVTELKHLEKRFYQLINQVNNKDIQKLYDSIDLI